MEGITIEELKSALAQLPEDVKGELLASFETVDTVAIKMELIKFVTELKKHNQGVDWETNKIKPKSIGISTVIDEATELFEFITK